MADILKVTPAELLNTANNYKTYQAELRTAYENMQKAVQNVSNTWTGDANTAFQQSFADMYANLSQTQDKMQDAIDELLKANDLFEEYEKMISNAVSALEEGTDPFS